MQCGAGGNHRVNRLFLFDHEVEQECAGAERASSTAAATSARVRTVSPANAVRVGQLDEVGADQRRGFVVALVEKLLPLAHHAQVAVVDDGDVDLDAFLHDGGQLGCGHLEAAVAGDDPDFLIRAGEFCADGCGQCESHGAQAAGGDERARMLVVVVLRLPHLVLAHVGDHDGVAAGDAPDVVDDVRRVEVAGVGQVLDVAHGHLALAGFDGLDPRRAVAAANARQQQLRAPRADRRSGPHRP